jgi:YHS domain-containing protein
MKKISVIAVILFAIFAISNKSIYSQSSDDKQAPAKTCIVSGETIEDGKQIELKYLDKTYNFCCEHCIAKFKKEPMSYIKEDLKCPVGGESASKDVSTILGGVKYYFCCKSCIKKFENDPDKYLNKQN